MKKQNLIIVAALIIGILVTILFHSFQTSKESQFFPEPKWVTEIKNKINLENCGPSNCEACETEKCAELSDSCKITSARYSCGPACDASISFCTSSEPAETGEDTYCNSNEDCWCRSFTGAQFIPGEKVPHRCNIETNRCLPCYYE